MCYNITINKGNNKTCKFKEEIKMKKVENTKMNEEIKEYWENVLKDENTSDKFKEFIEFMFYVADNSK